MHYFALPFVAEPQEHPTFKGLFQSSNWDRLRNDLEVYLNDLRRSGQFSSELVSLVLAHNYATSESGEASQESNNLYRQVLAREQDAVKTRKKYAQLVANHQQLRKDYQKLIGKIYNVCTRCKK